MKILIKALKKIFIITILLFLLSCSNKSIVNKIEDETSHKWDKRIKVTLVETIDGDTIHVTFNGKSEKVRLLLVDTPETSHPRLGEQPFGKEAKKFTTDKIENAEKIELEFDIGPKRDKYYRLLAYVYVDDKMLQEELLSQGFARVAYIYPPNTRYVDQFNKFQKQAQQESKGIWKVVNYSQHDGFHPEVINNQEPMNKLDNICNIKGNISSQNEKIYHTPESPWYESTKQEIWFCTVKEATSAGFRPPKNN